jgi:hypothetical protein
MQSPSLAQLVLHEVAPAQTRKFAHCELAAGQPTALPLHNEVAALLQLQMVPAASGVHAPAPLQPPATQPATLATQLVCGSWPVGTGVQVPTEPARLQAMQPPHAPESQHTPSMQLPDVQSPPPPQTRPFGRVGLQLPSALQKPLAQSPSLAHVDLQAVALLHKSALAQGPVDGAGQPVALPLQCAAVSVEPLQLDEHTTLDDDGVHAPDPLQPPAVQVALEAVQLACGSCPEGTALQVPTDPGRLQARQPLQLEAGESQHTPSTQLPVVHWLPPAQLAPPTFLATQFPPAQK